MAIYKGQLNAAVPIIQTIYVSKLILNIKYTSTYSGSNNCSANVNHCFLQFQMLTSDKILWKT